MDRFWGLLSRVRNCAGHWQVARFRFPFIFFLSLLFKRKFHLLLVRRRGTCVSVGRSNVLVIEEYGSTVNIPYKNNNISYSVGHGRFAAHCTSVQKFSFWFYAHRIIELTEWRIIMGHLFRIYALHLRRHELLVNRFAGPFDLYLVSNERNVYFISILNVVEANRLAVSGSYALCHRRDGTLNAQKRQKSMAN